MPGSDARASDILTIKGQLAATVVRGAPPLAAADLAAYLELRDRCSPAEALERITGRPDAVADHREGENVMCTGGYGALASALVWAGLQDQASNLGITTPTYLTPLYGAVGSGAGTPAKSDTALFAELGRQAVGAGASNPASSLVAAYCTWLFYFPSPSSTWTVVEAGVFAGATSATNSGTLVDHWAFSPVLTVPTTDSLLLQVSLLLGP